jgi:hypothetical protein
VISRILLALAMLAAAPLACETSTVECWPDPATGTACRCTQGPTPPACTDLGSCILECRS